MSGSKRVVHWSLEAGLAIITLDNPPVNVLDLQLKADLEQCLLEIEAEERVRVVIITAKGDQAFMAGGDIKEFPSLMSAGKAWASAAHTHRIFDRLAQWPRPTIAAINGLALGGGLELALCCDFRIAAEHVQLGLPEIKLGLFPGAGGSQRLTRLVGNNRAKQIMFLGDSVGAQEALEIGLVNQVVPRGQALTAALDLANKLQERPGIALNLLKKLVDEGGELPLRDGLRMEKEYIDLVFQTEDIREGVEAFIQKRKPSFKHK